MAISIDWGTKVITILQSDTSVLTNISGTLYELDTIEFRNQLKDLEDDEEGMPFPDTHTHALPVTVSGITYVPFINIINGYSITFSPDSQWTVLMDGASNNNFHDVQAGILNQNQVQVIPQNSAGNTVTETGTSGLTAAEAAMLKEFWQAFGLDVSNPVTHDKSPAQISFNGITLTLTEDVDGNVTVQRS